MTQEAQHVNTAGLAWALEWIPLADIQRLDYLQVRSRLDPQAVRTYRQMTQAGSVAPPIKVARVPSGALYLLDGWHRFEAGALNVSDGEVRALVATMSEPDARWEAATANRDHGVPLKSSEVRKVFRAFIEAGRHRKGRGQIMSYREMAPVIRKPHTTLRNWMREDFPKLFRAMGGGEGGNAEAGPPVVEAVPLADHLERQALEALAEARRGFPEMTPEGRGAVLGQLRRLMAELEKQGARERHPEEF